jgi:hypothetical protein
MGEIMNTLSADELRLNAQAVSIATTATGELIEAATRCELITQDQTMAAAGVGGVSRGMMKGMRAMNKVVMPRMGADMANLESGGLPKSFLLAASKTKIYVIEDKHDGGELAAGKVLQQWDREGFLAKSSSIGGAVIAATSGVPDDRQVLIIYVPIEGAKSKYMKAAQQQMAAVSSAVGASTGMPRKLMLAKDAPSQALIDAIAQKGAPMVMVGRQVVGGQAAAADPAAQLTQLAALRDRGVLTDEEFDAQKARILAAS